MASASSRWLIPRRFLHLKDHVCEHEPLVPRSDHPLYAENPLYVEKRLYERAVPIRVVKWNFCRRCDSDRETDWMSAEEHALVFIREFEEDLSDVE
ncbi:MAG: hypothetical protein AAGG48_13420 [Planctomycetota bacterium]